ncbi:hypothetical protein RFI_20621 [Reticulomyxa filosa]|uniref:Uncharacterized protein n=1 Tax=Reticulomyxa filosa TaxID=46433 RepID=X6MRT3_RETFI|nr:hypothetical protein RFI_20621 [Reticulomyxa filosa]|eukprot:ETO16718.1 hypothetical protein RFI_20621 [Reticulomyxa filosa]
MEGKQENEKRLFLQDKPDIDIYKCEWKRIGKLKAHTFSQSWKTLFVHFQSQVNIEELQSIAGQFNLRQQSKSQELDNDEKQEPKNKKQNIPFCSIFRKDYISEQLEKRKKEISKESVHVLKNVSTRESPQEVVEKCVLCKGQHTSNSILCPVIQKTRNTIGNK